MQDFLTEDFLLSNDTARRLYHEYAEKMPVVDYHCHINPLEIAEDVQFENISQVWLGGDHYKWRAIRSNGVPEKEITGQADDYTKFLHYARVLPKAIGNPLYHWTHLELKRYFHYDGVLDERTAGTVWQLCNEQLRKKELSVRGIIRQSNVRVICTTDDPADSLAAHESIAADPDCDFQVLPAFRPDGIVNIHKAGFTGCIRQLSEVCGREIDSLDSLFGALHERLEHFAAHGCVASDHGLDRVPFGGGDLKQAEAAFRDAMAGIAPSPAAVEHYQSCLMRFFAGEYARRGWVMQLHFGAVRDVNSKMFASLGANTGFDCIGQTDLSGLIDLLNRLASDDILPKTVLYSLHPGDDAAIGSIIGCFQGADTPGKLQHGSAWWFNDTKEGMLHQLTTLSSLSLLGNFIGMLTDSRSFLSYTRHEYFRRILCNQIAVWVENGEYPRDFALLGQLVQDISYNNAVRYFGFQVD